MSSNNFESIKIDTTYDNLLPASAMPAHSEEAAKKEPIVELKNIHKTYLLGLEGVPALRGVSLTVFPGEWVMILGTSGGGKTSLLNIIGTIDKPTKGEMKICNTVINPKTPDDVLSTIRLSKLGFVFQTFNLLSSMTALENVELPMTLKGLHSSHSRRLLAIDALKKVGLSHRMDHFPNQLSGGEQQRVTIARATANNPELLLLDEPTGDLDTSNSHKIMDFLVKLNVEQQMTMVMVTHDMALRNFAHRVVWMRDGKVAKIEKIPHEKRAKKIFDLQEKVKKHLSSETSKGSIEIPAITSSLRAEQDDEIKIGKNTKIRKASDYATAVFALEALNNSKTRDKILSPNSEDSGFISASTRY